ncbi:MAG: hypothetical protein ABI559_12390 [Chloroflexota bacterium]
MNENRLANEFLEAKKEWEDAAFQLHRAKAIYDYAEKRLWLARDQLLITAIRAAEPQSVIDVGLAAEIRPVAYLGKTLRQAAQSALSELRSASAERLVDHMMERGYQFSGEVPVRVLHGALVKQPWVRRNGNSGEWEYIPQ